MNEHVNLGEKGIQTRGERRRYLQIERGEEEEMDPAEEIGSRKGDQADPGGGGAGELSWCWRRRLLGKKEAREG